MAEVKINESLTDLAIVQADASTATIEATVTGTGPKTMAAATTSAAGLMSAADKAKIDGSINVLSYGVVADGLTDDATAIQTALDAADGKALYFPAGTYAVGTRLDLPADISIIGDPGVSIIQGLGSNPGDEFTVMRRANASLNCYMYGMRIVHNGQVSGSPAYSDSIGFRADRGGTIVIDNCEFVECPNAAIQVGDEAAGMTSDIQVINSRFWATGITGALGVDCDSCRSLIITGNQFRNIARAISLEPGDATDHDVKDVAVSGNTILDGATATISATNTCIPICFNLDTGVSLDNITIANNIIENCTAVSASGQGFAIYLRGGSSTDTQNITVTGNVIRDWEGDNSSHGVFIRSVSNLTFTSNQFLDPVWQAGPAEAGMFIDDIDNAVIANNIWTGTYDPACIQVSAATGPMSNVLISDNLTPAGAELMINVATGITVRHTGAGAPAISSDIGGTYHRTDGSTGTSFYVKESGTSTSGWVAK